MQLTHRTLSLGLVSLGFLALTACTSSEYDLTVVSFPGSQGAELSDDQGRVSTGLEDMVCTADRTSAVEDTYLDVRNQGLTVVDLKDNGTALVIDVDGVVSIVDPGSWDVTPSEPIHPAADTTPDEETQSDVDDAQFFGEGVATLTGCRLEAREFSLKLPAPCDGASLHEGNGTLLVWHSDQTVYEATSDGLVEWTTAHDLAWDGKNDQFLVLADVSTVQGWRAGTADWSASLEVQAIDVFPFQGAVGIRDADGYLWSMSATGGKLRDLGISIGTDGDVVGSVGKDLIALYTDGLYVLPL